MKILGLDPSSQATGVVLLDVYRPGAIPGTPGDVKVLARCTIRPKAKEIGGRCLELFDAISQLPARFGTTVSLDPLELVAIEDPTDYPYAGQHGKSAGGAAGKVGAAFGAVIAALPELGYSGPEICVVPSQEWIPVKFGTRRPLKKEIAREVLRARWPALKQTTTDETYAAGCVLYALTRHRLAANL